MRMVDLIHKKQHQKELSTEEIQWMIEQYTNNEIPDYQMSAMLMAIYFEDMTDAERGALTMSMVKSGDEIDLSQIKGVKVDKHSTGGVGDTTTLILAPLVASVGVPIAKMSGRGLGHTGGTIDKLEAIPGFHVELSQEEFVKQVNEHKVAVIGQSGNLTPADKKLYALRDVTSTVDSIPLIASSIMSKKIAAGADAIVLDVKTGAGAFMKTPEDARNLADAMVKIGNHVGRNTMAVISDMSQPLGFAIGNALEVQEAIDTLKGHGPADVVDLCLTLGSQMAHLAGVGKDLDEARDLLEANLHNGKALEVFKTFVAAQGGNPDVADDPDLMPKAAYQTEVLAHKDGYVAELVADQLGVASMMLGAGRATKESEIDLAVGLVLHKKVGDKVSKGEALLTIHSNQQEIPDVEEKIWECITIADEAKPLPLIYDILAGK
ncbi:pyrimidine-nucleoside phosphorylase [Desemzia incerta]|uniref:Pyrimidine-nucleoside phosphorylase n=1 Tax=Desemzia incerta TaxID=82801 RepID=A0A1I5UU18_9LACT|nr:pyrimidine-nucleoside phosphorylase [Desemzia incerta]SFP98700.1 pyrimidine-nucleoside phosphorylase [Desemzia incerta]